MGRPRTVKAVTDSFLIYIEQHVTEALCEDYPELKLKLGSVQRLGSRGGKKQAKEEDKVAKLSRRMDVVEQTMNARFDEVRQLCSLRAWRQISR